MQTILGAGGVIGTELAKALPQYTDHIRLVSRNPKKVNETDALLSADLTDAVQTERAVEGSEIVYLTAGLPYSIRVWEEQWPKVMRNTLEACKKHGAKLVFFDNVYCYGRVAGAMTEATPMNPMSKKGRVRTEIVQMLMNEVEKGTLAAQVARAADFYGPNTPLSFVNATVFDNMAKGKQAQVLVRDDVAHSLTYTPDAGKATAILGNSPEAYDQIWHLPTASPALTMKEIVEQAATAFGVAPKYMKVSKLMLRLIGLFNPVIKESIEMLYQNDSEYLFDSSKFAQAFDFRPTAYSEGIVATVKSYS